MGSVLSTTRIPSPQAEDGLSDKTHAGTDQDTSSQNWIGGLPRDIWLLVFDHMCPHCYTGPPLKPGVEFRESFDVDKTPIPLPYRARRDLLSMTMTCRGLRNLAQGHLFHCCDSPRENISSFFQRTVDCRSDLAMAVREMSVSSDLPRRIILPHLGNIRTLNFEINNAIPIWQQKDKTPPFRGLVGTRESLRHLALMPAPSYRIMNATRGRLWLENLMYAAPNLQSLRCHLLTDIWYDPYGRGLEFPPQDALRSFAELPENKITRLELLRTWLRFHSLEQLLQAFKDLREFRISHTKLSPVRDSGDKMSRPVDAYDVVTLLEPLKQQLEVLELDLRGHPGTQGWFGSFRPIICLADFTALKNIKLSQECIGELPGFWMGFFDGRPADEAFGHIEKTVEATSDFFVKFLPCRTLEYLQIDRFDGFFDTAVVEFARHVSLGGCPNLKHVRLVGTEILMGLDGLDNMVSEDDLEGHYDLRSLIPEEFWDEEREVEDDFEGYHDLKSLVPKEFWEKTRVSAGMYSDKHVCMAAQLFRRAGVLFERLEVMWHVKADNNSRINDGWMTVYPQLCDGGCGDPDCMVVKAMEEEGADN